ncbi:hypothetical protein BV20DRAFT_281339 [Pilatotrama ljubarskyi]|nr:hypothetical protein BV20DRAFT_281339 [Pilatotrama ljubarskyi]
MPTYCTHAVRILPGFRAVQHVFRIITFLRGYSKILIMLYIGSSAHSISAAARSCLVSGHAPGTAATSNYRSKTCAYHCGPTPYTAKNVRPMHLQQFRERCARIHIASGEIYIALDRC